MQAIDIPNLRIGFFMIKYTPPVYIAQVNLQRKKDSTLQIVRIAEEKRIGMLFIQEPELNSEQLGIKVHSTHKQGGKGRVAFINLAGSRRVKVDPFKHDNILTVHLIESEISIINAYFKPSMTVEEVTKLQTEIKTIMTNNKERKFILTMDANSRHHKWSSDVMTRNQVILGERMKNYIEEIGMEIITPKDVITRESCKEDPTNNKCTTIDLTCANPEIKIEYWGKDRLMDSIRPDHNMMIFKLWIPEEKQIPIVKWKSLNMQLAKNILQNMIKGKNVDNIHKEIVGALQFIQEKLTQKGSIRPSKTCKWWNEDLTKRRQEILEITRSIEQNRDNVQYLQNVRTIKKRMELEYLETLNKTRNEYFDKVVDDSKIFYEIVREKVRDHEDTIEDSKMETYLKESFDVHPEYKLNTLVSEPYWETERISVSEEETKKAMTKIKEVAAGPNNIKSKLIKKLKNELIPYITKVTQLMFETGKYPEKGKVSRIRAIKKPNANEQMPMRKQFRAISVYDNDIKIVNEILLQKTFEQMEDRNIGKISTEALLCQLWEKVKRNNEKKKKQVLILLDVEAAFNAASHPPILRQLKKQRVDKKIFRIHKNYLEGRKIEWTDQTGKKHEKELKRGTYQGATLASFHFALFMEEFKESFYRKCEKENHLMLSYVDDLAILVEANDPKTMKEKLEKSIKEVDRLCEDYGITISTNKAKLLELSLERVYPQKRKEKTKMKEWTEEIAEKMRTFTVETEFLGITITTDTFFQARKGEPRRPRYFTKHLVETSKEVKNDMENKYEKLSKQYQKNSKVWIQLYKQVWEPKLMYAAQVWGQEVLQQEQLNSSEAIIALKQPQQLMMEWTTRSVKNGSYETLVALTGDLNVLNKIRLKKMEHEINLNNIGTDLAKYIEGIRIQEVAEGMTIHPMFEFQERQDQESLNRTQGFACANRVEGHVGISWKHIPREKERVAEGRTYAGQQGWNGIEGTLHAITDIIKEAVEGEEMTINVYHSVFQALKTERQKYRFWINEINQELQSNKVYMKIVPIEYGDERIRTMASQCAEEAVEKAARKEKSYLPIYMTRKRCKRKVAEEIFKEQTEKWLERDVTNDEHYSHRCARVFLNKETITPLTRNKKFSGIWTRYITGHSGIFEEWKVTRGKGAVAAAKPNLKCWCGEKDTPSHQIIDCKIPARIKIREDYLKEKRKKSIICEELPKIYKKRDTSFQKFLNELMTHNIVNSENKEMKEKSIIAKKVIQNKNRIKEIKEKGGQKKERLMLANRRLARIGLTKRKIVKRLEEEGSQMTAEEKEEKIQEEMMKVWTETVNREREDVGKEKKETKAHISAKKSEIRKKLNEESIKNGQQFNEETMERRIEEEMERWRNQKKENKKRQLEDSEAILEEIKRRKKKKKPP